MYVYIYIYIHRCNNYLISYHITSYYVTLYYIILYYIISRYTQDWANRRGVCKHAAAVLLSLVHLHRLPCIHVFKGLLLM